MSAAKQAPSVHGSSAEDLAQQRAVLEVNKEHTRTWRSYVWSTWDAPPEEARFLTKLDLTLISCSALGVMIRYLDQVNITNAFNSGMREDLSLYGDELVYANALWSAAYVLGQIPSNLIVTRVKSVPLYIAFIEFAWTAFTFGTAGVTNTKQIYVIRFFVGLFEAGHFPAVMYVCSSYYKPHELARRNGIIQVFTSVGPLFSGFLMAAVHAGLNGAHGIAGWRWMFIICGVVSLPCALWTAFAMPQLPARAKANWIFTEREVELARERMPSERKMHTGLFKWKDIKRWHTTWQAWLFPLFFLCACQLGQSGGSMIFWLRSYNQPGQPRVFSVAEINIIPLGINFLVIFFSLIADWISDNLRGSSRWPIMAFSMTMGIIFPIALAATPVYPSIRAGRWALYYLSALGTCSAGVTWTLVNEANRHDPEKRAYVSALMNAFAYIFIAWVPIFTFPTSKQPVIIAGNYANAGFAAAGLVFAVLIGYMYKRDLAAAERAVQDQEALEGEKEKGSESGEETPGIDALPVVKTAELR